MKVFWIFLLILIYACSPSPETINYGNDSCSYCRMTIVDRQHAAEVVTSKNKAYKYDAIECMMNNLKNWNHPEIAILLVNDFSNPGTLIEAEEAYFLISKNIPSPMGAYLTAFSDSLQRQLVMENEGIKLNWKQLQNKFPSED